MFNENITLAFTASGLRCLLNPLLNTFSHFRISIFVQIFSSFLSFSLNVVLDKTSHVAQLLCISTRERVLRMPFAGQNQFFDSKTTFCVLLSHKMYKITKN